MKMLNRVIWWSLGSAAVAAIFLRFLPRVLSQQFDSIETQLQVTVITVGVLSIVLLGAVLVILIGVIIHFARFTLSKFKKSRMNCQ